MKFALDHAKGNRQVMPNHPYPSIEKDLVLKQDQGPFLFKMLSC
jgi:hypothetical protein